MRFIDMFAGMGTARMAFEQAEHTCVYSIEWDKHKRKIYEVIFGNEPEGSDIRRVRADELPKSDCWTAGFPCQDISVAGKQTGFKGHRSSLFFAVTRLIRETPEEDRPSYLLFENVKNFFSVNSGYDFLTALIELDEIGYDCEWQLLNSKHFRVPQNRERVFIVGHLRGRSTRKVFPITIGTGILAKGSGEGQEQSQYCTCLTKNYSKGVHNQGETYVLQKTFGGTVTKKLNETGTLQSARLDKIPAIEVRVVSGIDRAEKRQNGRRFKEDGEPMFTLTKQDIHGVMVKQIGNVMPTATRDNPNQGRVYDPSGIAPCLNKMEGGGREPHIVVPEATKKGYTEAFEGDSINLAFPESKTRRGRVGEGVAQTLDRSCNQGTLSGTRIRRLTPKECMRLQGVSDSVTDKLIQAGISDTQLYRAVGDAWTVNVGYEIARRMEVTHEK